MASAFRCRWVYESEGKVIQSYCYTYGLTKEILEEFISDMGNAKTWAYRPGEIEEVQIDQDMQDKLKFSKVRHVAIKIH